jgi:hypothetical protein
MQMARQNKGARDLPIFQQNGTFHCTLISSSLCFLSVVGTERIQFIRASAHSQNMLSGCSENAYQCIGTSAQYASWLLERT